MIRKRCLGFEGERCVEMVGPDESRCPEHQRMVNRRITPSRSIARTARWRRLRLTLLAQNPNPVCAACGKVTDPNAPDRRDRPELDHVVAVVDGGAPYDPANVQWLCKTCNARKGATPSPRPRYARHQLASLSPFKRAQAEREIAEFEARRGR